MALIKSITDEKGVKSTYHIIHNFELCPEEIKVKIRSYTSEKARLKEKQAVENNRLARQYQKEIYALQDELDQIIGKPDQEARVLELTKLVNEKNADGRPVIIPVPETFYSEDVIILPLVEPVSREIIYNKLVEKDAEFEHAKSDE